MLDLNTIVLAIDLEDPSLPTAREAAALARRYGSEIILVHAVPPPSLVEPLEVRDRTHWEARSETAEARLDAALHGEFDGLRVRRVVLRGEPAQAIAQAATEENAKLIVIGTHGFSGVPYVLVGSVTARLLSIAECPVWTDPHSEKRPDRLEIRHVLCGLDLSPAPQPIAWAAEIARDYGAKLTLVHVTPSVATYAPGGYYDMHGIADQLNRVASEKMAKVKKDAGVDADVVIVAGDTAAAMDDVARKMNADLLVIGRRPRPGWIGGNAYPIISRAHVPVLSI